MDLKCKVCLSPVREAFTKVLPGEDRLTKAGVALDWHYYECTWCHAVQTYVMDELDQKAMTDFYAFPIGHFEHENQTGMNRPLRAQRFVKRALQMFPGGNRELLCFGVGSSAEPKIFKKDGWKVTTCDFGPDFDLSPLDLPVKNRFKAATAIEVLEHLRDPRKELGAVIQSLEPGGFLVASTGIWSRLPAKARGPGWWYTSHAPIGHIFFWSLQALDEVAQANDAYVILLGKGNKLCQGMSGLGQHPLIIRRNGQEDA